MPLVLSPPYLALLGATVLFFGVGEDAAVWTAAGAVLLLGGVARMLTGALHRRRLHRLRSDGHPIRAEVTGVVAAPIKVGGRSPYRLVCRGLTPPVVGRVFRSSWILRSSAQPPPAFVTVLIDPKRMSRSFIDVAAVQSGRRPPLQRVLRHVGALGIVLGAAFVEIVAIGVARTEAPPGPVHGDVQAGGARFSKGGLYWRPDLCRASSNPGVTAVALIRKDAAYPVAWVITDPASKVAAVDVQQRSGAETVRFPAAACTRLHGEIRAADVQPGRPPSLAGYVDAECREPGGGDLTLHADFAECR